MLRTRSLRKPSAQDGASKPPPLPFRPETLEPLSDSELLELGTILADAKFGGAMNVEELDGFFAALLVGPFVPKPCQYWPVVLGKAAGDKSTLDFIRTTTVLLPFLARHWESIAQTVNRGKVHPPYLIGHSDATKMGRDWSCGFLRGVEMQAECWQPLIADDDSAAAVLPMMILAHADDPDPMMRPPRISVPQRDELIRQLAVGLIRARRYFSQSKAPDLTAPSLNLH